MKPQYFDIHSHINAREFAQDLPDVLARMQEQSVWTITVGTHIQSSESAVVLAETQSNVFATIGLHPTDVLTEQFDIERYAKLAAHSRVVAIGECGLDYYRAKSLDAAERARQQDIFEAQIDIAVAADKPLMLHCRNAHAEAIEILRSKKKEYGDKLRGNVHFFTDTVDTAKQYFDLDFTISFTGVVTFAREYDDVVRYAPLTHIMSETDCPYAAPIPHRGKRNEPAFVVEIVKKIAEIRGEPLDTVATALVDNALRVFNIPLK